jgi:hypothetical protein
MGPVMAGELPRVHWAGLSFAGEAATAAETYPHAHAIHRETETAEEGRSPLQVRLAAILDRAQPAGASIVKGEDIDLRKNPEGLAMTLAIDGEYVSVDRMSDHYQVMIWLSAQAMIFDFSTATVLASHPLGVLRVTTTRETPSPAIIRAKVQEILLGEEIEGNVNLLAEFGRKLAEVRLRRDYPVRVQLREVRLAEKTLNRMPAAVRENPAAVRAYQQFVGSAFAKALSSRSRVPVLPYLPPRPADEPGAAKLAEAGAAMAVLMGRVSDARVFNLRVPQADFVFDLEVAGFSKAVAVESLGVKKWAYVSYVDARFLEPASQSVYLRQRLVNPAFEDIPDGAQIDDWAAFGRSLYQLMGRLGGALSAQPDEEWMGVQPAAAEMRGQLKVTLAKLELCR